MFNELLSLYKKNSDKTPLEDFTTEVFVGILNEEEDIKQKFITDILKLDEDTYQIKTQEKFILEGQQNSIPDYVLYGKNNICFVENKVNSPEGYKQLNRYSKVLDSFSKKNFNTKLIYCTKYADPKERTDHDFLHIRWYQIAQFLKDYQDRSIVKAFIQFLKIQKMAQELTITAQDFIVFENIQKTMSLVSECLDGVKNPFEEKFNIKVSNKENISQLREHNNFTYKRHSILGKGGYAEIEYGFSFGEPEPSIFAQIWVSSDNSQYKQFVEIIDKQPGSLKSGKGQLGHNLMASTNLSQFLYKDSAINEVSQWFKNAFDDLEKFIKNTPNLHWNIKVKE